MTPALHARLAEIVGAAHILTDADALPHAREWRGRWPGSPACVVRPGCTAEVSGILALATAEGLAIVPQGGNTGLVGGQMPDASGRQIVVALGRMNALRALDPAGATLTAEAGMTLAAAQAHAASTGLRLPLSLASEGTAQLGGLISSNAGGVHVLAHGSMRAQLLGLETVLAGGAVLANLRGVVKDNTGYALDALIAGSEGTLGIITAAGLRLAPIPAESATAFVGATSPEGIADLFARARSLAGRLLEAFELMPRLGVELVVRHATGARDPLPAAAPWCALIEIAGPRGVPAALMEDLLSGADNAVLARSAAQAAELWALRHAMSEVQSREGASLKHDIAVPVSALPAFLAAALPLVAQLVPGARPVPFGHFGDGNLHFNISQPAGGEAAAFLAQRDRVADAVHALVLEFGGTISAEHGIGQAKREALAAMEGPVAMALMRRIKHAFDPAGVLNPGKLLLPSANDECGE